jgi:hypothetical protein
MLLSDDIELSFISRMCFCIELSGYFSGNYMYLAQSTKNSPKAWLRTNPDYNVFYNEVREKVESLGVKAPSDTFAYEALTIFYFDKLDWLVNNESRLRRNDLTNLWKPAEDAIAKALEIDDSLCINQRQIKGFLPLSEKKQTPPFYYAVELLFYRRGIKS